tara:strand:+ start:418 stop:696 length:279 start_codon:yes stop_codon:yes gene_type:complete
MEIKQRNTEEKGLFKASENNIEVGMMTYTWAGTDRFIIDHTEVKPEFKGKSVGNKLVIAAVEFARKMNVSIIPLCPFAKSVFDKTKDIRYVL